MFPFMPSVFTAPNNLCEESWSFQNSRFTKRVERDLKITTQPQLRRNAMCGVLRGLFVAAELVFWLRDLDTHKCRALC
jgi:capsular polysaccharide biosynthesis protein